MSPAWQIVHNVNVYNDTTSKKHRYVRMRVMLKQNNIRTYPYGFPAPLVDILVLDGLSFAG